MLYSYRVEFESDMETGDVVVSLPGLNHTTDSGRSVEEALDNLRELASGFIEVLHEQGEPVPPSDLPGEGLYLFLEVEDSASVRYAQEKYLKSIHG